MSKGRKPPGNKPVLLVHPDSSSHPEAVIGVIGPFPHRDAAEKWATEHLKDYGWSVAELCHPDAFYESRAE